MASSQDARAAQLDHASDPGPLPGRPTPDALDHEVHLLELLQRTGAALAAQLDVHGLIQTAVDTAAELAGAQLGAIFYRHGGQDRGVFSRDARSGAPREAFAAARGVRGVPLLATTFVRGEHVLRGELGDDELPAGDAVRSYLAVPLVLRTGELIGGCFLGHRERHAFTARTQRLVTGIAAQAGIALVNARIYEDARRASEDRARLLERERAARAELERTCRRKAERLAALAHDLRAPLNAIVGWSEILLARGISDGEALRGLEAIARNARAQAQLIDDLRELDRGGDGAPAIELRRAGLAATVASERGDRPPVSLAGVRVLVIDDDGDARDLVKVILSDAQADAITAASADEGLALLRERKPDVIVSDIAMALRDGYQFIRLVRTLPAAEGGRTPALALTAFVQPEDRARALLAGYQEHAAKPVEARELVAAVHRLAGHAAPS